MMQECKILSEFVASPVNLENCVGCRMCVDSCPSNALKSEIDGNVLKIGFDAERCYGCGVCADACPFSVIGIVKKEEYNDFVIVKELAKFDRKAYHEIERNVIESGLCCGCGACTVCPPEGIVWNDGVVEFPNWIERCRDCSICLKVCQRYNFKPKSGLGEYIVIVGAKSKRFKGQDGAMVSEFLACALETGLVDVVLVVGRDEGWKPQIIHVKHPDQLLNEKVTGTKYSISPILPELNRIIKRAKSVAIVGTPCIVTGLRMLQREIPLYNKVKLAVSLFCMENLRYPKLKEFLEGRGVDIKNATKFDIKKGKFIVKLKDGSKFTCPVKELDEFVSSGCHYCRDFSGLDGDVSVGSVGTPNGYSTVIIRSETAKKLYEYMKEKGYLEECEVKVEIVKKLCNYKVKKSKSHA
ncbi:Coenzyme F420 hydrogenase/dehydrogenase, beta subunit C-terminal domain [Archaeoglobus sp.]